MPSCAKRYAGVNTDIIGTLRDRTISIHAAKCCVSRFDGAVDITRNSEDLVFVLGLSTFLENIRSHYKYTLRIGVAQIPTQLIDLYSC
jgi:hypothetical protein